MTQEHPITPPPELVQQWTADIFGDAQECFSCDVEFSNRAAQWGADMELAACCRQLTDPKWYDEIKNLRGPFRAAELRAARRPKPPSLKEQALSLVEQHEDGWRPSPKDWDIIRRALEALPDSIVVFPSQC
jgi:hypothetical protein